MSFTYTDKIKPDSSAIDSAYYNEDTENLFVVLTSGNGYRYSDVPGSVWEDFASNYSAGRFYAKTIKRGYGPGDSLGYVHDWEFERASVPAPDMGPVTTFTGNLQAHQFVAATTGINTAVLNWNPTRKHTVKFHSGISDREYVVETTGVNEAVADLMRLADMLGLRDQITVKEVVTHFE